MKKIILIVLLLLLVGCEQDVSVSSPNGRVEVIYNNMTYQVKADKEIIIDSSNLGIEFKDSTTEKMKVTGVTYDEVNEKWSPVWGQRSLIENHYNQMTITLENKNHHMAIVFRVFNDGLGFRYEFLDHQALTIMDEKTEFKLRADHTAWWIKNDWDSYEYLYRETPLSEAREVSTPFTMKTEDHYISIHEAALIDYAGMALKRTEDLTYESHLAPWPNGDKVRKETAFTTPWRTIQIGRSPGDLIESSLILNLNEPTTYEETDWIQPMKYMGIWWEMHISKSDWGRHNNNHGATTENAKMYIDFIEDNLEGTIGLLVEGWNQGWDGNWMDNYDKFIFTEDGEYEDFDVSEVATYGQKRDVTFIMHNETSGGIENYEAHMHDAYADYQRLGIHAIKSGYVSDNGMMQPEKVHHHGQYMVNHYNQAVELAADYQIMINTHEPIKPTGLSRTYPNWVAREGVQGMEYNAWSDGNPPDHTTILPFTRILGGPIDYTPGIFDVEVGGRANRVHTTRAKQLALYVVLYSPLQMITDLPENYLDENGDIYPEFEFIKNVPVDWDETYVPSSEIGDFVTIVRKAKDQEAWFVGSITDEEARTVNLKLDFLGEGSYTAKVYADGENVDYLNNPNEVMIYEMTVTNKDTIEIYMPPSGGQAIHIFPDTEKNLYHEGDLDILDIHIPKDLLANEVFTIDVKAVNSSSVAKGKTLEMKLDGQVEVKYISMKPNSKKTLEIEHTGFFEAGVHTIEIEGKSYGIEVTERPATFIYESMEIFKNGDDLNVRVKVRNVGSVKGSHTVELYVDDILFKSEIIEIEAGENGVIKGLNFTVPYKKDYIFRAGTIEEAYHD